MSVFPKATCRHWWANSCQYSRIFVLVDLWIERLFSFHVHSACDTKDPKPRPGDTDSFTVTQAVDSPSFTAASNGSPLVITKTLYARKFKLPGNSDVQILVGVLLGFACLIAASICCCGTCSIIGSTIGCPPCCESSLGITCGWRPPCCSIWDPNPSLDPAVAMVDHSTANLDGTDPPPSRVIGDGSDAPNQSPLQRQVLSTSVYADPYSQQSRPALEVPSSNVNKQVLYGDGSDGPSRT